MSVMPIQKPGRSVQVVGTPRDFLNAVEARFGRLDFDLAATSENSVIAGDDGDSHFGPGSSLANDSLLADWDQVEGNLWLNPEFADIGKWARKCAATPCGEGYAKGDPSRKIFLFVPLTTANYACDFIHGKAFVLGLNPRITFVGHTQAYPKDMMLAIYGERPGFETWRWKP